MSDVIFGIGVLMVLFVIPAIITILKGKYRFAAVGVFIHLHGLPHS